MSFTSDPPTQAAGSPPLKPQSVVLLSLIPISAVCIGALMFRSAWIALGLTTVGLACAVIAFRHLLGKSGETPARSAILVAAFVPGLAAGPALLALSGIMGDDLRIVQGLEILGLTGRSLVRFSLALLLLIPFLEELFWRGVLFSDAPGLVLSDLLFAAFHMPVFWHFVPVPWLFVPFLGLSLASWFWRRMRSAVGYAGIVLSHFLADLTGLAAVWYLIRY